MALRGRLVWSDKDGRWQVIHPTKKGESQPILCDVEQLAPALRKRTDRATVEVDLDLPGGKPMRIRPVGEAWGAVPVAPPPPPPQPLQQAPQSGNAAKGDFHNPYNFIPAPPRRVSGTDLADREPTGHDCYHAGKYSGTIRVRMTTVTPLLIPDAAKATVAGEHKTFGTRVDAEGKPYLPPTSVKGMLRSAFEAVTNSRMGVFPGAVRTPDTPATGHGQRLAFRLPAQGGLTLVPVRVENIQGQKVLRILTGTSKVKVGGTPNGPMYAAWLPRYHSPGGQVALPDGPIASENEVWCWVERIRHYRWDRGRDCHVFDFEYWRVRAAAKSEMTRGAQPAPSARPNREPGRSYHEPIPNTLKEIHGWVHITNRNFSRKHDERVFFVDPDKATHLPLTSEVEAAWGELIRNYQAAHKEDLAKRGRNNQAPDAYLGGEPGRTAWSAHVYQAKADELKGGEMAYAAVEADANGVVSRIIALYPVMISRKLYPLSPLELLPESIAPAVDRSRLSPADRVFGWVHQKGHGAYRGNLRVGPVDSPSDALQTFPAPGVPLAILGEPKPQQGRFYVAGSPDGEAQRAGGTKENAGFCQGKGLRGRKVYPHHRSLTPDSWRRPALDGVDRDNQNRSILSWVKSEKVFSFDLHVTNLSQLELGALLWLLTLDPKYHHRLGGGKPLGFGSVRLEVKHEGTDLRDGAGWKQWYGSLDGAGAPETFDAIREKTVASFEAAIAKDYGGPFPQVSFIAAFLKAAEGYKPIHYPRSRPEGDGFKWFGDNDKNSKRSLPDLAGDQGLPYNP